MPAPADVRQAVEYFTIELSQLADGAIYLGMTATTVDDEEPQLLTQEIVTERVSSIDEALALVKDGVARAGGL